jgi:hypothetical protein
VGRARRATDPSVSSERYLEHLGSERCARHYNPALAHRGMS